jgi:hypothetical protein
MSRVCIVLSALASAGASLEAQQRWERQVEDRLQRAVSILRAASRGAAVPKTWRGPLNTDESVLVQATLFPGESYTIVAVCDDDCSRLQLALLTPGGSDVAKDRSGTLPTIRVTVPAASAPGAYAIRVGMEGCRWNPCWYGVAVVPLGKRTT